MRLVFLGSPDDAVPTLRALVDAGHEVALVVTQPDRRRGRGSGTAPSPVNAAALELGLDVRTPSRAREVVDEVWASGAELGVVVAFGQLLPDELLEALPHGFVNLHFSLLPRWRGAAPVERVILAGDTDTGVCVMRIDSGLDTGPVYACERTPIDPDETAGELRARLVELGTRLMVETLPRVPELEPQPQQGEPTYADKLTVDEFRIDWFRPADEIMRVIRAGNPRPGAWTTVEGKRLKIWRATRNDQGVVEPVEVQPEGRPRMTWEAWRRGHPGTPVLGT
ncbi:MAG: methionyl-tRNA formyltransferase [Actinobacteria bacterium]|nr:methionyl-tRNA formyltransferase [Actinomycetota bacterium]